MKANPSKPDHRMRIMLLAALFALLSPAIHRTALADAPAVASLGAFINPLRGPARVAVDTSGRIYTTDPVSGEVAVMDAFGRPLEVRSGYARPLGIAVDSIGNIYLGEEGTGSVSVFDSKWNRLSHLGKGTGEFVLPSGVALDPASESMIYVCDSGANQIKVYNGSNPAFSFGSQGAGAGQFDFPSGIFVSAAGEVFVVDQNNDRVEVFDRLGNPLRIFALKTSGGMSFGISGRPQGITGDNQGRVYIADSYQGQIKVFTTQGVFLSTLGQYGEASGQLRSPAGVAIDSLGRLLVASVNNGRVELLGLDTYIQLAVVPASQVVPAGNDVTFLATLSGSGPFVYQWFRNGIALKDAGNITGANADQVTVAGASPADSGDYSVVVVGPNGTFASPVSTLKVMTPPAVISQPANFAVSSGTAIMLSASVTGDNLSYQWRLNGTAIPGATSSYLIISNVGAANSGNYTLVVSNTLGSVVTDPALLTVVNVPKTPKILSLAPQTITLAPLAQAVTEGMHLVFEGDPGFNFVVEGSTDLADWTPLGTVVGDSAPVEFLDTDATTLTSRFYRLRWQP